jgi:hypothetical protein
VEDVVALAQLTVSLELLVEPSERGPLVARDHRAGMEAPAAIGEVLVDRQPHECLDAGEEDPSLLEQVLVLERDLAADASPRGAAGAAEAGSLPGAPPLGALSQGGRRGHRALLTS